MTYASVSRAEQAHVDPLRSEPIRFLVGGGVLPSRPDDEFWRCLKFFTQARRIGLSLAEIRGLLAIVRPLPQMRDNEQTVPQLRVVR